MTKKLMRVVKADFGAFIECPSQSPHPLTGLFFVVSDAPGYTGFWKRPRRRMHKSSEEEPDPAVKEQERLRKKVNIFTKKQKLHQVRKSETTG